MNKKKNNGGSGQDGKPGLGSSRPFQDLAQMVVAFPELPDFQGDELDVETLKQQGETIRQKAEDVKKWVAAALAFLDRVATLDRETRELAMTQINTAEQGLERLLHQEKTPAYRRAAWLSLLRHLLSREFQSPEEVKALFRELVQKGHLQESPDGLLKLSGISYTVPEEAAFGDPEIQEIAELMKGLSGKVLQAEKAQRRQRAEQLTAQSEMTLQEFLGGKEGRFALQIPPEQVIQNDSSFWRPGGLLLVESDGEKTWPIGAVGGPSFEGAIGEAMDLGVYLFVPALQNDRPPYLKRLPEENRRKLQLLWYLLKRGIKSHEEQERILAVRTQLAAKATLSQEEFFLEEATGICLAEYRGIWHTPDNGTVPNLFFLVERRGQEDDRTLALLEVPDHLTDFLGDQVGQQFPEEEQFKGVSYPLGAVLKAIYGQTRKAAEIASKQD